MVGETAHYRALPVTRRVGKWLETIRCVAPPANPPFADDRPHLAVTCSVRAVGRAGFGWAGRMGVKIAEHSRPVGSFGAVRVDQRLRVDLEMVGGLWVHVFAGTDLLDLPISAEQEPACLVRMLGVRQAQKLIFQSA